MSDLTLHLRQATPADADRLMDIWRSSVDATHDFLHPDDRVAIEAEVHAFLPQAPLWLAVDAHHTVQGFMLLEGDKLEALFVSAQARGRGVGKKLVMFALATQPHLATDVNAQNAQALGFYLHLGFRETGRSALDGQGRPYPLVHLQHA